jgi:uncharacterized C2H2 Zn-finger protein
MFDTQLTPKPASEPGALDGFSWTCPRCGMVVSGSLESYVRGEVRAHVAYHAKPVRKTRKRAAAKDTSRWAVRCDSYTTPPTTRAAAERLMGEVVAQGACMDDHEVVQVG